jgi:hypothetical protein
MLRLKQAEPAAAALALHASTSASCLDGPVKQDLEANILAAIAAAAAAAAAQMVWCFAGSS